MKLICPHADPCIAGNRGSRNIGQESRRRPLAEVTAEAEAALQRLSELTVPPTWAVVRMSREYTSLLRMLKGNATGIRDISIK